MNEILTAGFSHLGLSLPPEALGRFAAYHKALEDGNAVMNLTAITGVEETARLHFLDCAALLGAADLKNASVIDVGTGAGFPGMVLKIAEPSIHLTLLDSLRKRVDFLETTGAALGLTDIRYIHGRAEEMPQLREQFDFAVSRAVARLNLLCELCLPFVKVGGSFLAMKGPGAAAELEQAEHAISLLGGEFHAAHRYTIPGTDLQHCVVEIRKLAPTPEKYPRRFAKMQKAPL